MTTTDRSQSFGSVASAYSRYRPSPPLELVEWLLPKYAKTVIDLGAGTGALSSVLVTRVDQLIAVEPDDRMRVELALNVPGAQVVKGQGESIPVPDSTVNAVLASASWHWMDPIPTLNEVARVLVPGGWLGAVWAGPDPDGALLRQAKELLSGGATNGKEQKTAGGALDRAEFSSLIQGEGNRPDIGLVIPDGVPFTQPEHRIERWSVALTADDLVGLLGTFSWIIALPVDGQQRVFNEARRILKGLLGVEGDITVDIEFMAQAWRSCRHG